MQETGAVQGHPEQSAGYKSQEFRQTPPSRKAAVLNNGVFWHTLIRFMSVTANDPNEKVGFPGFNLPDALPEERKRFVSGDSPMAYEVLFENLETAYVAAQEVLITDQLDSNLDWSTFSFGDIRIGERGISFSEKSLSYESTIDLRPSVDAHLQIACNFNPLTGIVQWLFRGIDPETGELADFLPPNTQEVQPLGQSMVFYEDRNVLSDGWRIAGG